MQCLSVKQPAAGLICRSEKTIENRSRKLFAAERYQLPFWCLVHASATWMRGEHSGFTVVRGKKGAVEGLTRTAGPGGGAALLADGRRAGMDRRVGGVRRHGDVDDPRARHLRHDDTLGARQHGRLQRRGVQVGVGGRPAPAAGIDDRAEAVGLVGGAQATADGGQEDQPQHALQAVARRHRPRKAS